MGYHFITDKVRNTFLTIMFRFVMLLLVVFLHASSQNTSTVFHPDDVGAPSNRGVNPNSPPLVTPGNSGAQPNPLPVITPGKRGEDIGNYPRMGRSKRSRTCRKGYTYDYYINECCKGSIPKGTHTCHELKY